MNIYRIIEDGDDFCIRAKNMQDAVKVCEVAYVDEATGGISEATQEDLKNEGEYYHAQVLQSCQLVGELKN